MTAAALTGQILALYRRLCRQPARPPAQTAERLALRLTRELQRAQLPLHWPNPQLTTEFIVAETVWVQLLPARQLPAAAARLEARLRATHLPAGLLLAGDSLHPRARRVLLPAPTEVPAA